MKFLEKLKPRHWWMTVTALFALQSMVVLFAAYQTVTKNNGTYECRTRS